MRFKSDEFSSDFQNFNMFSNKFNDYQNSHYETLILINILSKGFLFLKQIHQKYKTFGALAKVWVFHKVLLLNERNVIKYHN